ncbi:MAG: hypothetical protein KQH63_08005 [Desulfobulbaceae bacterium]|nr:hypothetical protein [Desulfobulbaceae bacterium]
MKKFLAVFIKSLLVFTAVALTVLLIVGLVLLLDWPWWTGFFFALLIIGLAIGGFLLRKMILRRREQQFVEQIVSQDDLQLKGMAEQEKEESRLLQIRWKEAIETLKRSHLRKFGNPLYVLPWYLVIGESASGKTTAIKSAKLSSPFAEGAQVSGLSGTRNCDWWFFEQSIIIDTAGRYAIPVDESRDKDEWRNFLSLLSKYRKKEPLNGLIVSIAADKLLGSSPEELANEGLQIRNRIDELMLSLGSKFPVYVLVTKCDLIKGMTQFCDKLPESVIKQAMGMVTPQVGKAPQVFWKQAIETVSERLSNLLLRVLHDSRTKELDPALILFPCEFERLALGLESFMGKAFQENPYQETPILRGLFFTSGRQEGTPYSHFLHKLGLLGDKEVLAGTNRGMFLHDFFAKILPMDRGIFAPTRRVLEWRRLSRNLGLTSWVALITAFCVLMSFSFVKNLRTMREVPKEFLESPIIKGDLLLDVVSLDQYQQAILKVEERNRNWWIPRFGLHESIDVEEQLKENFSQQFRKSFLQPMDTKMSARMAGFTLATPNQMISRHVSHLVRRINLLNQRLKTRERELLFDKPRVSFLVMMSQEQEHMIPEIKKKMADMYLHYLLWNKDDSQINLERNELQAWLKQTLAVKGNQLDWLVVWANEQDELKSVALEDFWGGSKTVPDAVHVAPAFTKSGKEHIDAFLQELEAALPDPGVMLIARQKIDFADQYRNLFIDEWRSFAAGFSRGGERLSGYEEWLPMAQKISGLSGPYFSLLDKMVTELAFVADMEKQFPAWISLILQQQAIQGQASVLAKAEGGALVAKAGMKSQSLIGRIGSKLDSSAAQDNLDNQLQAARALLDYQKSLKEAMLVLVPRKAAYEAAAAVYNGDKTAFGSAKQAVSRMKTYMTSGKEDEDVFWTLLSGPVDFLWSFERTEAACYLQERWEKDVVVEVQGIKDRQKILQLLLDQDGYAMQFIKGPAAPFLSRNPKKGYYAVAALDGRVNFDPGFLDFLTRGVSVKRSTRPSYDVSIKGMPTEVNSEAQIKPHATHVELQCASSTQKLSNFQFQIMKSFTWSQETCGDVLFEIEVSDMVLTKIYRGTQAFPSFLNDFKTGRKKFYPGDFPDHQDALKRLGIKYITVNYQFAGHKPVLELLRASPGAVPSRIVTCWD